ncbi:hypothetical protein QQ045_011161 [Rhodiola kirilowii]
MLWYIRNLVRHGQKGLEHSCLVENVQKYVDHCDRWLNGRNRMTLGLWGYCHMNEGLRKLNCDGSFSRENNITGFAIVEKTNTHLNCFIAGWNFYCRNAVEGEIFAILQGLLLAARLKIDEVVILSDSLEAVDVVLKGKSRMGKASQGINQCVRLLEVKRRWTVEHVLREDNEIADKGANC